jgi:hypothetical protein
MPEQIIPDSAYQTIAESTMERLKILENKRELTVGEKRVRTQFNPSANEAVDIIKQNTAHLIDMCEELKGNEPRLAALAQTAYEEAAMWAVKAATA